MSAQDSYITLTLDFGAAPGTDTTFTVERSLTGLVGSYITIATLVPLLDEEAVYVDTTAPLGVALFYTVTAAPSGEVLTFEEGPIPELGQVYLKDPGRPWADIELDLCDTPSGVHVEGCAQPDPVFVWGGLGDESWNVDAGLFPILNAEYPADVWARRKFANGSMTFFTRTLDAADRVYDLFTAGGPLLLQLPPAYGWDDHFIQPGTVVQSRVSRDQRIAIRRWEVPFVVVDRPADIPQGTACANWCAVQDAFPTYGDFVTTPGTFLDLLQGDVLCPGGDPMPLITDTFERTVAAGGWGVADTGETWTVQQGPAADFSVAGGVGLQTYPTGGSFHVITVPWAPSDTALRIDFSLSALPVGDSAYVFPTVQYTDTTHMYMARVQIDVAGVMTLTLRLRNGAETQIGASFPTGFVYAPGAWYSARINRSGTTVQGKVWLRGAAEPGWQITTTDATLSGPSSAGARTLISASVTNLPLTFSFDNLRVTP